MEPALQTDIEPRPDAVSPAKPASDLSVFVERRPDGTASIDLAVEGIDCAACIGDIEGGLRKLPGLIGARLNFTTHRLAVEWHENKLPADAILAELERIGYRAHPFRTGDLEAQAQRHAQWLLKCLGVAGFAAMNIMLLSVSVWSGNVSDITDETRDFFHWLSALIALPAAAYAGQPFFQSAWRSIKARNFNMDVPISLGVFLTLGLSLYETAHSAHHAYFDSAVMLLFFLLCGRYLDHAMRRRTRQAAANIAALRAVVAHRLEGNGELVTVPVAALREGDEILVRPGERLPADGVALLSVPGIDESLVTGETQPRPVRVGETVYSGSLNGQMALRMRVTRAGEGSFLDEVERLVNAAGEARSRYQHLADRAAKLYSPVVHAAAILTAFGWLAIGAGVHKAVVIAVSVLIITCPCALALAVPAVQVVAAGALFRRGLLISAGDAIERLATVDTVIFDKTGTLTMPQPAIANGADLPADMVAMAGRLALSSHHPLAKALVTDTGARRPLESAVEVPGEGVEAVIDGRSWRLGRASFCDAEGEAARLAESHPDATFIAVSDGERRAVMAVSQRLRPDAIEVVARLRQRGFAVAIMSGDRDPAVARVAARLGIEDWTGAMKPADKIAAIEARVAAGQKVLMVGDGVNDAPALAAASVSLSPITAADIAQAQADAVFLGDRLGPVIQSLDISRKARRLMVQNLWLSVVYNVVAVPLAVLGYVTPLVAALAMSGSSVIVTLNALRGRPKGDSLTATAVSPEQPGERIMEKVA
jgi:Cu2+-exporting ATPase